MEEKLNSILKKLNIIYISHFHPAFFTVKEGEKYEKNFFFMRTKSLFLKDEYKKFYLITLQSHTRVPISTLKKNLKLKKLEFATPEELLFHLKVKPGSVSLFCIIHDPEVTLLLDKEVWLAKDVGFHPNENTSTLELKHFELEKFYNSLTNQKEIVCLN